MIRCAGWMVVGLLLTMVFGVYIIPMVLVALLFAKTAENNTAN
jgi:hypothetical protein